MKFVETIIAFGHENMLATHKTTFEITKEATLSKKGNCIIAVSASRSLADLSREFKENLRKDNAKVAILIEAGKVSEMVTAYGSSRLVLTHSTDMVVRKSDYICNRTLAVKADKAAEDLSRKLVEKVIDPKQKVKITLTVTI